MQASLLDINITCSYSTLINNFCLTDHFSKATPKLGWSTKSRLLDTTAKVLHRRDSVSYCLAKRNDVIEEGFQ